MAEAITEQGRKVAAHWSGLAITYEGAVEVLRAAGIDPAAARAEDLHAIDMIHMGGLAATDALAQQAGISPGERVLDVGAGVGGSSRRFADRYGAIVTSVELSETLARTAERLNELVGLSSKVTVMNASALSLPVESANFDVVVMQHVAMQIAEKDQLFGELSRALAGLRCTRFSLVKANCAGRLPGQRIHPCLRSNPWNPQWRVCVGSASPPVSSLMNPNSDSIFI